MSLFSRNDGSYTRFGLTTIRHWNPCGCLKLETGAKLITIVQMVVHFATVLSVGVLFMVLHLPKDKDHPQYEWSQNRGPGFPRVLGFMALVSTVYFFLHCYLYKAIKERDYNKVNRYWKIMLGMTIFTVICTVATMDIVGGFVIGFSDTIDLFLDFYILWVIQAYRKDLRDGPDHTVEFERVL